MRCSIRYQLLFPILVLLLGMVGGSAWVATASVHRAVHRQIEDQLRLVARTFSEATFPFTPRVLAQIRDLSGAEYLLLTEEGRHLSTLPLAPEHLPPPGTLADSWEQLQLGPAVRVAGQAYLYCGVRLRRSTDGAPETLYLFYPEERWREALWEALRAPLLLALVGAAGAVGLARGIAYWLTGRIRRLEKRTRMVAAGDFRPMTVPRWNDELRDLAGSVNDMARQLACLQEAVRKSERLRLLGQVSSGLVHQLRNGVGGARLAVQVHTRTCGGGDQEALEVALRQLTLVEEKLQRFLHLGRDDGPQHTPCPLVELLDEAITLLRPQCRHRHIDLRWQPPSHPVMVTGDRNQLGHLFVNVLGNAVEAIGAEGRIEVRVGLTEAAAHALIEVVDSGPGPPPEVAERLFEEFVTSKSEGVGLGLAVARRVAEAHGGRIDWRRADGQTCFRILLPVGQADVQS